MFENPQLNKKKKKQNISTLMLERGTENRNCWTWGAIFRILADNGPVTSSWITTNTIFSLEIDLIKLNIGLSPSSLKCNTNFIYANKNVQMLHIRGLRNLEINSL